ncbi:hypothetical protein AeRB84_020668 [Aphanomyces euteiches]|nr:hypothetical protein AeRB84_020668 [Aphanomyces euteiches]
MCRSKSTETIRFDHFSCEDDAIGVTFHKTKTKQQGTTNKDPKHCFANPLKPAICLFTALGIYLASHTQLSPVNLFPGSNQKDRFGKCLSKLLDGETNIKQSKKKAIGTLSVRKGAATFCSSGSTGGPSIVSVCLRCGWSLGNVMERYFCYESAGDQFAGRVVAGLPVNSANFSVLPPHFPNPDDPVVVEALKVVFPSLHALFHLQGVLRLCLASIVYHHEFLVSTLPSTHALLSSTLFRNNSILQRLKCIVQHGCESTTLQASGVPPHVELYRTLAKQEQSLLSIPRVVLDGVRQIIEENGFAAGQITREFLSSTISAAIASVAGSSGISTSTSTSGNEANSIVKYDVFMWGGRLHKLPEDFVFPSVDLATGWKLWFCGNPAQKLLPFQSISTLDLATRKQRNVFYEWKFIMSRLSKFYESQTGHKPLPNPTELQLIESFDVAQRLLAPMEEVTPKKRQRRTAQLKVATTVGLLRQLDAASTSNTS